MSDKKIEKYEALGNKVRKKLYDMAEYNYQMSKKYAEAVKRRAEVDNADWLDDDTADRIACLKENERYYRERSEVLREAFKEVGDVILINSRLYQGVDDE